MKKTLIIAVLASLALVTCFSPWQGDEAVLTVSVGGSGNSRILVPLGANYQPNIPLTYELILESGGKTQRFEFDDASTTVKVPTGKYNITVRAMGSKSGAGYSDSGFPDTLLRALGEDTVTLRGGKVSVSINMISASEVTSWAQLDEVTVGGSYTVGDPNYGREEIILLKNGATSWASGQGITIQRPITLRAVEEVAIKRGHSSVFFIVDGSGTLILEGPLTLDGDKVTGNATSLISVTGGELTMNNGVTLKDNKTTSNGGAVNMSSGSIFTMNGNASVYGNEAVGYGGGVFVNGGTFNMYNTASVYDNKATNSSGGGVYIQGSGGTFNMYNNASVHDNTSSALGGGVAVQGGEINMYNNASVYDNEASSGAGGIFVDTTFTMQGGVISGNKAIGGGNGGGVYVSSSGTFSIVTGTIYGTGEGAFSNTVTLSGIGAASYVQSGGGIAQYGDGSGSWANLPLDTDGIFGYYTDNTIRVVNGVKISP